MSTRLNTIDINELEKRLVATIVSYRQCYNQALLSKICVIINAIMQHQDFIDLSKTPGSYYKVRAYWLSQCR
ncbi:hypothetical protein SAMN05216262_10212 [Colwellia chukchiensis]|uniref:Uncharacterized protein n=1 Tax=Colwellia chukchiensis TaxID=641665 RepID=A0A1H7IQ99_9GAMM|nr:hypothetical protein [Colwellia chukchiensis]SEK64629.1 hypothetical protein SAMN05216262_10212 [Colwellia chukchiensis]